MGVLGMALASLAAIEVQGVTSYALGAAPERLGRAHLPALILVPEAGGAGEGLAQAGFSAGEARLSVRIAHVLIAAPLTAGTGRGSLPELIALIDAYAEALAADPRLGGALPLPLRFRVQIGPVRWGGIDYHGATFLHEWTLHLG